MWTKRVRGGASIGALLGVLVAVSACSDTPDGADGGTRDRGARDRGVVASDGGGLPSGLVTFHAAGATAELSFGRSGAQYLVVPYSTASAQAEALAFTVTVSGASADGGARTTSLRGPSIGVLGLGLRARDPARWARWQQRLGVEQWTRAAAVQANRRFAASRPSGVIVRPLAASSCVLSSECGASEVCAKGSCSAQPTIKIGAFASTAQTITAQVKRKGSRGAILVETGVTVADTALDELLRLYDNVIHPRDVALFGDPALRDGQATRASDRNGDGLVWIVITPKVAEKNDAVGFFVASDFVEASEEPQSNPPSNEADILYLVAPSSGTGVTALATILAHELQHLLGFASKSYRAAVRGGQPAIEALWLDEGQSHFAEDACGFGGENVTLLKQELFPAFGDTALLGGEDTLRLRASALLFVRFLFEQKGGVGYGAQGAISDAGGAAWLAALHTTSEQGRAAIEATYGNFKSAFERWLVAVGVSNRGVTTSPQVTYRALIDDATTGSKIGALIRGRRRDDTGKEVDLAGPLEDALGLGQTSGAIANATGKYYLLSGLSGTVRVKVTSSAPEFGYAVITLK